MADFLGTRIDRYEIEARIGMGGMARVYKARDTNLERTVALKILHEHLAEEPNFKERFEREAKLIASLNHPNIVQVYDFNVIQRDGFPVYYMVMPFIAGKTLRDALAELNVRGELFSFDRVLEIMLSLTEALGYAHSAGMIHRDVKPANIMLTDKGKVILTDFGIARMVESSRLTQDGISTGTPTYMSPEQAIGLPGDARSDIYALGVILFELLTGRPPFGNEGGTSVIHKHLNEPPPHVSNLLPTPNQELDAIISKALEKKPQDRYQTASEFGDAIKSTFLGKPILNTTRSLSTTTSQSLNVPISPALPQRSLWQKLAVLAGVAVLIIGLVGTVAIIGLPGSSSTQADESAPRSTSASSRAANPLFFTSTFEQDDAYLENWPTGERGAYQQEITSDGLYHLRNERQSTAETSIFNPTYVYTSVSISMTGTILEDSNPAGAFGIVFRYSDEDHYNVFAVDGMGRYSVWARLDGGWRELRGADENWTPHPAINPSGEENRLLLDTLGSSITGYVNGEQLFRLNDSTLPAGNVGIYVATHTEGFTDVEIDSYQTYPAAPPSMTGG